MKDASSIKSGVTEQSNPLAAGSEAHKRQWMPCPHAEPTLVLV